MVRYGDDGLVAAIVQDVETNAVLMMAWMNAETLRMSLEQGRTVFWSRSRQEVWRKGDTSGDRQFIRSASYDCDGDTLAVQGRAGGQRRLPHRRVLLLLPRLRSMSAEGAAGGRHPRPRDVPTSRPGAPRRAGLAHVARRPHHAGRRVRAAVRRRRDGWSGVPAGVGRPRRPLESLVVRRARAEGQAGRPSRNGARHRRPAGGDRRRRRRARHAGATARAVPGTRGRGLRGGGGLPAAAALGGGRVPRLRRRARGGAPPGRAGATTGHGPTRSCR